MPLKTIFLCGPAGVGKTAMAEVLAREVLPRPPHYIRLVSAAVDHGPQPAADAAPAGMATAQRVAYTPERVFEVLPEALRVARGRHRSPTILIEADCDPCLRHAHPYDYRLFLMAAPDDIHRVFRKPAEASVALKQVMEDTAAFATEIFGLFDSALLDDDDGVRHRKGVRTPEGIEDQIEVSGRHVEHFVLSPLGAEIASRIQLQPAYHAVVESDVVVFNTAANAASAHLAECVRRIQTLLHRTRASDASSNALICCDPFRAGDAHREDLLRRLRHLLTS